MKTLQELQPLIINWAKEKGINNVENQRLKLIEECGELAKEIITDNKENQKNEIGDIFVVLIVLADLMEENLHFNYWLDNEVDDLSEHIFDYILNVDNWEFSWKLNYLDDITAYLNHDLTHCANLAWEKIKNRKGTTKNGSFIKN